MILFEIAKNGQTAVGVAMASSALIVGANTLRAQIVTSQKHPDVIAAKVTARGADSFDFDVTLSSPFDTPERYADAFRVSGLDGQHYGERILLHDHQNEQPFTRDLYGVKIPTGIKAVVVQGRDQKHGYGGKTLVVALPGR